MHARPPTAIASIPAHKTAGDVELSPIDAKVQRGKVVMSLKNVNFAWVVGGGDAAGNAMAEVSDMARVSGDVKGVGGAGPTAAVSSLRSGFGSVEILSGADLTVCEGDLIGARPTHRVSEKCMFFCTTSASLRDSNLHQP